LSDQQVQASKCGTGRVVGFRELGLVHAFTIEASFSGASTGENLAKRGIVVCFLNHGAVALHML